MKMRENQIDFLGSALIPDISFVNLNRGHLFEYVLDKVFESGTERH